MTPGRKFSITTSERTASVRAVAASAGSFRSSTMLRLLRFALRK